MLTTKLVLRVLDAGGELLAWAELLADARGDGCLWPQPRAVSALVDRAGQPALLSVHWADVNVEVRSPFDHPPLTEGGAITLAFGDQPVLRVGPMPGPLPPVTVRAPVVVTVPVGALGAVPRANGV